LTLNRLKGVGLKRQILFGRRNAGVTNIHSLKIRKLNSASVSGFDAQFCEIQKSGNVFRPSQYDSTLKNGRFCETDVRP